MQTLDEIRAMVDPEGYLRGMREVLENYRSNLSRLLVDYDLISLDETLGTQQRSASMKQCENAMRTTAGRIRALEVKMEDVKRAPVPNRADRRRAGRQKDGAASGEV